DAGIKLQQQVRRERRRIRGVCLGAADRLSSLRRAAKLCCELLQLLTTDGQIRQEARESLLDGTDQLLRMEQSHLAQTQVAVFHELARRGRGCFDRTTAA